MPVDATNDWYRRLGASHHRHSESVRLNARAIRERERAQQLACYRRWPEIVLAMRALVDRYNSGAGRELLVVGEGSGGHGGEPTVTVTARSGRTLEMAVEGADLWVRASRDENGRTQGERWIGLDRTAEATADYVLQNWLMRLEPS